MNIANNKIVQKKYVSSAKIFWQKAKYKLLTKSYYCVMENITVSTVNAKGAS